MVINREEAARVTEAALKLGPARAARQEKTEKDVDFNGDYGLLATREEPAIRP